MLGLDVGVVAIGRHWWRSFAGSAAPIAAFVAITQAAGSADQNPKRLIAEAHQVRAEAKGRSGSGGWRRSRLFCFAMQRRAARAGGK
ncbi:MULTISPECIES: hypothetical protein [unclassified Bradyrhizobium]|uniref:hypothetical protein n=1 Tax=unclassified Bradyrhizobium TaxID=2631580 RepID=UPI0029163EFC|nr:MULTISPECIES: hypothetical protein [unclassified Bradyrhizobium]